MTWKEFKRAVEAAGVRDDDAIDYIDVSASFLDVPGDLVTAVEPFKDGTRQFSVYG